LARRLPEAEIAALEQRLRRFYVAYYSEIRQRMSGYPAASDIFPYYLVGHRRIVATLTKDGLVVTHWPAEQDSFEFHVSPTQKVRDITESLAVVAPSGMRGLTVTYPPDQEMDGAVQAMAMELEENGVIYRPEWIRLDASATHALDEKLHDEEKAREDATRDVLLSVNAFVMDLTRMPLDQQQSRVLTEFEAAVDQYEELIASDPEEWRVQMFLGLRRNRLLLDPTVRAVTPEVKLGDEYRVDFVLELPQERHVLVEIERPRDRLYTKDGDPADRHKHGQQQIMDWIEWLDENKDYARKNIPSLRTVKEPEYWLIVGLRRNTSEQHQRALTRKNAEMHRIKTMTFDDLLDQARQHLDNLRGH